MKILAILLRSIFNPFSNADSGFCVRGLYSKDCLDAAGLPSVQGGLDGLFVVAQCERLADQWAEVWAAFGEHVQG